MEPGEGAIVHAGDVEAVYLGSDHAGERRDREVDVSIAFMQGSLSFGRTGPPAGSFSVCRDVSLTEV